MRPLLLAAALTALAAGAAPARADAPAGVIHGVVIFEGEAPTPPVIARRPDFACGQLPVPNEDVVVTQGKLRDVVVRIVTAAPPLPAPAGDPAPAIIDQRGCAYVPRVLALDPKQGMVVRNADQTFHNVHGLVRGKELFNKAHPQGAPELPLPRPDPLAGGEVVELACDVHPWMHAYAVQAENGFHAVTAADGTFTLSGLPPGKYHLEAWHATLGTRGLDVVVGAGAKASVNARLSFKKP